MHVLGINPGLTSAMLMPGSIAHEIAGLDNPFGDQFVGVDPMDLRHGVFAWNGQPVSGGGLSGGRALREITMSAESLSQTIFPGCRAPSDGNVLAQVAKHPEISKTVQGGKILVWTQAIDGEKIPLVYALCELPTSPDQVFDTLLDVNGIETWMPRVMLFRSEDADAKDLGAMRRRFSRLKSIHLPDIASRYKTTVPHFYGRFAVDYRQLPGGALQMEWNIKGDQTVPDDLTKIRLESTKEARELKPMKINNSSFTLIPSPENPGRTFCAYHLNAQPVYFPFVASIVTMFVPRDNANELDCLFQSLLNRTTDRRWTGKRKDPYGLDLSGIPSPTPHRFTLQRIY